MRVAIDVSNFIFGLTSGTSVYLYHLIGGLLEARPHVQLVLLYHHRGTPAAQALLEELAHPRVQIVRSRCLRTGLPPGGWWVPRHPALSRFVGPVDVYHAGDFVWPPTGAVPTVVTVHDLSTERFPDLHWWANRWHHAKKLRWARAAADRVIAVSEATKQDLVQLAGFAAERIDVVPEARRLDIELSPERVAARVAEVRRRCGLEDAPYILTVGTLEPRKNHVRLVRAFESLPDAFSQVRLVVVGGAGWKMGPIRRAFQESSARERIRVLGIVPPEDLAALYAGASLFAYPSLYEGFGLPVLEAMAMGVAVLTSSVSSLPELAGDAAVLVDPRSVDAIRDGLARLLGHAGLRDELARRGRERERGFTWRRTAELTLASYERAIRDRARRPAGAARR